MPDVSLMAKKDKLAEQILAVMEESFYLGYELALLDAIVFCYDTKRTLPEWAFAEIAERSHRQATGKYKPKKKKGRLSQPWGEQEYIVKDARCFGLVNDLRGYSPRQSKRALKTEAFDAFAVVGKRLHLGREGALKAYYRHKKRMKDGTCYVSLLHLHPDYVAYLTYNQELLDLY